MIWKGIGETSDVDTCSSPVVLVCNTHILKLKINTNQNSKFIPWPGLPPPKVKVKVLPPPCCLPPPPPICCLSKSSMLIPKPPGNPPGKPNPPNGLPPPCCSKLTLLIYVGCHRQSGHRSSYVQDPSITRMR